MDVSEAESPRDVSEAESPRDDDSASQDEHDPAAAVEDDGQDATPDHERPLIPTKQEHWDDQKVNIEELYVVKNLILKEVIDIMHEAHNFKATARMYKRQFAKWGWKKYNKAGADKTGLVAPRGARLKTEAQHAKTSGPAKVARHRSTKPSATDIVLAKQATVTRLLFENEGSYRFESILSSYAEYISGWSEPSMPWRSRHKRPAGSPQELSILQNFRAALDHFDEGENESGGVVLRRAFRQVEDAVADQNVEAIWDCCLAVPQLALSQGREDILLIFAKYLKQLTSVRLPGHPLTKLARDMERIAAQDPKELQNYITRAWKLWIDTITRVRGREDPVTIHLKRGYVILMTPEASIVRSLISEFENMAQNMLAAEGEESTTATILELENLLTRMYIPLLSTSTRVRADALLNGILMRLEHKPCNKDVPIAMWNYVDRYLSFSAHNFLASIADFTGEFQVAEARRAMILTAPKDGFWVQTAAQLEKYLREEGRHEEADEIARQRLEDPEPLGHGTFV